MGIKVERTGKRVVAKLFSKGGMVSMEWGKTDKELWDKICVNASTSRNPEATRIWTAFKYALREELIA